MKPTSFLEIVQQAGKLKTQYRHNWLEEERKESVADHSWRIALMAMMLSKEEGFENIDMDKVIRMCLIHDLGESFIGDIPAFEKTKGDEMEENALFLRWVSSFEEPMRQEWAALLEEMDRLETLEAKTYKALDKLEAVISHNEADLSTWLPLEYDLQFTYGRENVSFHPYFQELKKEIDAWTRKKIGEK